MQSNSSTPILTPEEQKQLNEFINAGKHTEAECVAKISEAAKRFAPEAKSILEKASDIAHKLGFELKFIEQRAEAAAWEFHRPTDSDNSKLVEQLKKLSVK